MPSSETILNRSLCVLFCFVFFPSDDLNYLIITIGCSHWKTACFSHRPTFSPNSCSGCGEPPSAVTARYRQPQLAGYRQQPGHAHWAQRCLHSSPKTQGKSAGPAVDVGGRGGEPGHSQASATLLHTRHRKGHQSLNLARSSNEFLSDA